MQRFDAVPVKITPPPPLLPDKISWYLLVTPQEYFLYKLRY